MKIEINNLIWEVAIVPNTNPELIVNGTMAAGTTWFMQQKIYLSADLTKDTARNVISHELAHAYLMSTQIRPTKDAEIECYTEEEMCNFTSMWGESIFAMTDKIYNELYCKE